MGIQKYVLLVSVASIMSFYLASLTLFKTFMLLSHMSINTYTCHAMVPLEF